MSVWLRHNDGVAVAGLPHSVLSHSRAENGCGIKSGQGRSGFEASVAGD